MHAFTSDLVLRFIACPWGYASIANHSVALGHTGVTDECVAIAVSHVLSRGLRLLMLTELLDLVLKDLFLELSTFQFGSHDTDLLLELFVYSGLRLDPVVVLPRL